MHLYYISSVNSLNVFPVNYTATKKINKKMNITIIITITIIIIIIIIIINEPVYAE